MATLDHPGKDCLGTEECAPNVDTHHAVELLGRGVQVDVEAMYDAASDARVVDEDVDLAERIERGRIQSSYIGLVADVGLDGDGAPPARSDCLNDILRALGGDLVVDYDGCAIASQIKGDA